MITLYNSKAQAFEASSGAFASNNDALLNILIELRVQSAIMAQVNSIADQLPDMRADAVNDARNPSI